MKSKILLSIMAVIFTFSYAMAEEASAPTAAANADKNKALNENKEKHKQVVEDYKKFLASIPPATREEIREYRKSVIKANKEKAMLYKKLSQEAQDFLAKERSFKTQLPLKDSRLVAAENERM